MIKCKYCGCILTGNRRSFCSDEHSSLYYKERYGKEKMISDIKYRANSHTLDLEYVKTSVNRFKPVVLASLNLDITQRYYYAQLLRSLGLKPKLLEIKIKRRDGITMNYKVAAYNISKIEKAIDKMNEKIRFKFNPNYHNIRKRLLKLRRLFIEEISHAK